MLPNDAALAGASGRAILADVPQQLWAAVGLDPSRPGSLVVPEPSVPAGLDASPAAVVPQQELAPVGRPATFFTTVINVSFALMSILL